MSAVGGYGEEKAGLLLPQGWRSAPYEFWQRDQLSALEFHGCCKNHGKLWIEQCGCREIGQFIPNRERYLNLIIHGSSFD